LHASIDSLPVEIERAIYAFVVQRWMLPKEDHREPKSCCESGNMMEPFTCVLSWRRSHRCRL
jgi:hypothetical protein